MNEHNARTLDPEMKSQRDTKQQSPRNPNDALAEHELCNDELSVIRGGAPMQGGYYRPD